MTMEEADALTVFEGERIVFSGPYQTVAAQMRDTLRSQGSRSLVAIENLTGRVVDIDLRDIPEELPRRGRGRPKLGVASREVTLLPRHWEWLAAQPGGASAAIRRLVEDARRSDVAAKKAAREAAYRVMTVLAGDRPGYEEAVRALYADNAARFAELTDAWPADVRDFVRRTAALG
jgi:hypothetical protein